MIDGDRWQSYLVNRYACNHQSQNCSSLQRVWVGVRFGPRDGQKQYTCSVEIYTEQSTDTGQQITMECSGEAIGQFKQALTKSKAGGCYAAHARATHLG